MEEKLKQQVLDAFLLIMRPIARILLRYGISHREFSEVAKTAFVDIGSKDFGLRGRQTNISRVAVMTGLTRKEVKRVRDEIAGGERSVAVKTTPISDVLHQWHAHADYTDKNGAPLDLPFSGDAGSFTSLVRAYGGDVPAGAMRTEMVRVGVVTQEPNNELRVVARGMRPDSDHERLMTMLVHGGYALLSNIAHNTDPSSSDATWASRIAYTTALQESDSGQLRRITKDRIADFAESIDDLFIAYESLKSDSDESEDGAPVAVGVFYFEERDKDADYKW